MQAAGSKADRKSFAHLEEPTAFDATKKTPLHGGASSGLVV